MDEGKLTAFAIEIFIPQEKVCKRTNGRGIQLDISMSGGGNIGDMTIGDWVKRNPSLWALTRE